MTEAIGYILLYCLVQLLSTLVIGYYLTIREGAKDGRQSRKSRT